MRPSMMIGGRGLPRAAFVGSAYQSSPSGSVTLNFAAAGAEVGDFCIIHVQTTFNFPTLGAGGDGWAQDNFTWAAYSYRTSVFRKRLTSLSTLTINTSASSDAAVTTLIYRGPNAALRRVVEQQDADGGALSTTGFIRAPNCVGVVGFLSDRDVDTAGGTVTSPGGTITQRRNDAATFFRVKAIDALGRSDYVDGAPVNWPGSASGHYRVSQLYELLIT